VSIRRALARRLRALVGAPSPHSRETSDREADRARRRIAQLEAALEKRQAKWELESDRLRRAALSRYPLSPDIVRELLPYRARTLAARAGREDAVRADARLLEASRAYRDAIAHLDQPQPDLVETDVQGFRWTVPVPPTLTDAARDRFVAKQRFPYRGITQTREFSVGPILLDIGANIGRMSIPRVVLGDFERAYCAEPDPLNYAALVRNVAANGLRGLVLPDQTAIGSAAGPVQLRRAKYPGGHSVATGAAPGGHTIDVPCQRLDDWCEHLQIDPALVSYVKVDTQGWESHVFQGATRLLTHPHVVWQIEVQPSLRAGTPDLALYAFCAEHFTHFVDLNRVATGPRARRTADLPEALAYLIGGTKQSDIILFNASDALDRPPGHRALTGTDESP
jgi:FkbM family methyltransferase